MSKNENSGRLQKQFVSRLQKWLGLASSEAGVGGASTQTVPGRRPAASASACAGPVRPRSFEERLKQALRSGERVAVGKLQILNVASLRRRLHDGDGASLERIHLCLEGTLRKHLGRDEYFIRYDDENYAIVYPGLDELAARLKTIAIANDVLSKFFGAGRDLGDLRLKGGAASIEGSAMLRDGNCSDSLFEALESAETLDIMSADAAPGEQPIPTDDDDRIEETFARLEILLDQAIAGLSQMDVESGPASRTRAQGPGWHMQDLIGLLRSELDTACALIDGAQSHASALHQMARKVHEFLEDIDRKTIPATAEFPSSRGRPAKPSQTTAAAFGEPTFAFEPLLNLKHSAVSTYMCVFYLDWDGCLQRSDSCIRYPMSRVFHPMADLLVLSRAAVELRALLDEGRPCAISATVHADTLDSAIERQRYIRELAALPHEIRRLLMIEIIGFEVGIWPGKVVHTAQRIAHLPRACFARLNLSYTHIPELGFGPLSGLGTCFQPNRGHGWLERHLDAFARKTSASNLLACITGVDTPEKLEMIRKAGVLYAGGLAVSRALSHPLGVVCWPDLTAASGNRDRDPRSLEKNHSVSRQAATSRR